MKASDTIVYIRLHGSYEALKYGTSLDGLSDFTGGIAESVSLRSDPTTCGRLLSKLLDLTSIVTAVVSPHSHVKMHSEKLASGIVMGINYRIYSIEKVGSSRVALMVLMCQNLLAWHCTSDLAAASEF